ncbi:unnamed protein product, partial [Linum tenue]
EPTTSPFSIKPHRLATSRSASSTPTLLLLLRNSARCLPRASRVPSPKPSTSTTRSRAGTETPSPSTATTPGPNSSTPVSSPAPCLTSSGRRRTTKFWCRYFRAARVADTWTRRTSWCSWPSRSAFSTAAEG